MTPFRLLLILCFLMCAAAVSAPFWIVFVGIWALAGLAMFTLLEWAVREWRK